MEERSLILGIEGTETIHKNISIPKKRTSSKLKVDTKQNLYFKFESSQIKKYLVG
jgi:hypothetical protein